MNISRRLVVGLAAAALFFWLAPGISHAMGISPVRVDAMDMLPGTSVKRTIYMTRSNPAQDDKGVVRVLGPAAKYIRLPNDGQVPMPKGLYNTPFDFYIEPGTLGQGNYTAMIQVAPYIPPRGANDQGGSGVVAGAQATIYFSVTTTAAEDFEINNPGVNATEEGQILDFTFQFDNKGNVDARPSKIDVSVKDQRDETFSYAETISGQVLKFTKALTRDSYDVPTKAKLAAGSYFMKLKFYKGEQMILESRDMKFEVYPRGTLAQKGELASFEANKAEYESGELVLFKGTFANTGKVGLTATLNIVLRKGDQVIEVLSTDPMFVPRAESVVFEKNYRPADSGQYSAVAAASYLPYKTNEIKVNFTVKAKLSMLWVLLILSLILIILGIIIMLIASRKKKMPPPLPPPLAPVQPSSPQAPPAGGVIPSAGQISTGGNVT